MSSNVPREHPIYARMDFPAYEYREYPKFIGTDPANRTVGVIVNDEDEEAQVRAGTPVVREADARARLIAVAEVHGVQHDKRWSVKRLTDAITDAGFDADEDPFA